MNEKETASKLSAAIAQHRLTQACNRYHSLKSIYEILPISNAPTFGIFCEYIETLARESHCDKIVIMASPIACKLLNHELYHSVGTPVFHKNIVRLVQEHLILSHDTNLYVMVEKYDESSVGLVDHLPVLKLNYHPITEQLSTECKVRPISQHIEIKPFKLE